jgi:hypothetical protein
MINLGDKKWGVKDSGLLAYKQVGSKFFNKAFDFARGSRGTYVGRDGLIKNSGEQPTNLVQNGDFSQLGSELIVNGDFSDGSANWENYISGSSTVVFTDVATLNVDASNSNVGIYQENVFASGKQYKVVLRIKASSSFDAEVLETQGASTISTIGSVSLTTSYQDFTFYFTGTGANDIFIHRKFTSSSANQSITIDNVSVKQVDPNDEWTLGAGWSIGDGVAVKASGTSSILFQSNIVESSKLYKLTFDVIRNSGFITSVFLGGVSDSTDIDESGSYTYYITSINQDVLGFNADSTFNGSISNISVQEIDTNTPRIDFTDDVNGHLLLEGQRSNLVTYSEDFSNAYWTKTNSSITSNIAISPDGSLNADKLVEGTNNGSHNIQRVENVSNATIYTSSVFVKYGGREWIRFTDAQSSNRIHFNTLTGAFGAITGTVIDYNSIAFSNGWYKLSITTTSVATAYALRVSLAEADNDVSYTGDGTSGVYIWGAQLEQGSYATSYIKSNSGSTTTRTADVANNCGTEQDFNSEEGVLYAEIKPDVDFTTYSLISISDGTTANNVVLGKSINTGKYYTTLKSGNSNQFSYDFSVDDVFNKIAVKYKANDFAVWLNGVEVHTDNSGSAPIGLDRLAFDFGGGSLPFYGKVISVKYFPTALGDSKLITLTGGDGSLYGLFNSFEARVLADGGTIESQDCIINELKELL